MTLPTAVVVDLTGLIRLAALNRVSLSVSIDSYRVSYNLLWVNDLRSAALAVRQIANMV
jgi:hypothetical protein